MIGVVGDIHGNFTRLSIIVKQMLEENPSITAIIQVGDFGYYPKQIQLLNMYTWPVPIYWIDGNHEFFNLFINLKEITEVHPNIFYVPRGTVLEIDDTTFLCIGGAASVDEAIRRRMGWHFDSRENITPDQLARCTHVTNVDYMITHVPPASFVAKHFDPMELVQKFDLSPTWTDPNAAIIEDLWTTLGRPKLFCGHMHRSITEGNVQLLDIYEWTTLAPIPKREYRVQDSLEGI